MALYDRLQRGAYLAGQGGVASDVYDRNRGAGLPSAVSDDAYARLAWTLEKRAGRRPPVHRGAARQANTSTSEISDVAGAPTYVGRRFASITEVEKAGFVRVAACTYVEKAPFGRRTAQVGDRVAHPIWELRGAEDGQGGYLLVRKREERDVDLRVAEQAAGIGTAAAVDAGIVRMGRRTAQTRGGTAPSTRTAAPKFQVSLLQTPGGSIADRKTIITNEEMDLPEIERLVHEIKMGPAELNYDTWSDGEWELRVRGPRGEYIHEHEAVEPGEIGGEKGRGLLDMVEGAVNAPPPGEEGAEAFGGEGVEPIEEPPADLAGPMPGPPEGAPPPAGGAPAGPPPPTAGLTARVRQGQRVLCIRRGQVADAVVLMVRPQEQAIDLMFGGGGAMGGGEVEQGVPMEMLIEPDMGGDEAIEFGPGEDMDVGGGLGEGGGEAEEGVEVVDGDDLDIGDLGDPFGVEVEPASKDEPMVFGGDEDQFEGSDVHEEGGGDGDGEFSFA